MHELLNRDPCLNLIKRANRFFFQSSAKICPDNIRIHVYIPDFNICRYFIFLILIFADTMLIFLCTEEGDYEELHDDVTLEDYGIRASDLLHIITYKQWVTPIKIKVRASDLLHIITYKQWVTPIKIKVRTSDLLQWVTPIEIKVRASDLLRIITYKQWVTPIKIKVILPLISCLTDVRM